MRTIAFDLETARILPPDSSDLLSHMPLGIACAAIAFSDRETEFWHARPQLDAEQCRQLVRRLQALVRSGYRLVTWNGCSFDFRVLAHESSLFAECGEIALNHVDLMAYVTFSKGYPIKLDKALAGAGLGVKIHAVTLEDGRVVDPSGANAPILWAQGQTEAVLAYQRQDVEALLKLAQRVVQTQRIQWTSTAGREMVLSLRRLLTMRECFELPAPDTSWMTRPPLTRHGFVEWIPGCGLA
jgi:hypothetical protein